VRRLRAIQTIPTLALALAATLVTAQIPKLDANAVGTYYPTGEVVYVLPDGTVRLESPNGFVRITTPDGKSTVYSPDGNTYSTMPDGTKIIEREDGSSTVVELSGDRTHYYHSGRTVKIAADGVKTTTEANGATTVEEPSGDRISLGPPTQSLLAGGSLGSSPDLAVDTTYPRTPDNPPSHLQIYGTAGATATLREAATDARTDTILFSDSFGLYPKAGAHMLFRSADGYEGLMQRHIERMTHNMSYIVPDPDSAQIGVLDMEEWWPFWTLHPYTPSNLGPEALDHDFLDDWRDHIRATRPQDLVGLSASAQEDVFRTSYLEATKDFWLRTLQECQRLRPNMTWGFYGLPIRDYWSYRLQDAEQIAIRQARNDTELAWVWQESDAIFPSFYSLYYTLPEGETPVQGMPEDTAEQHRTYIRSNMLEAQRVANGKPVFPFLWWRYHTSNIMYGEQFVNEINLSQSIQIPLEMGADGLIFWDYHREGAEVTRTVDYLNTEFEPTVQSIAETLLN